MSFSIPILMAIIEQSIDYSVFRQAINTLPNFDYTYIECSDDGRYVVAWVWTGSQGSQEVHISSDYWENYSIFTNSIYDSDSAAISWDWGRMYTVKYAWWISRSINHWTTFTTQLWTYALTWISCSSDWLNVVAPANYVWSNQHAMFVSSDGLDTVNWFTVVWSGYSWGVSMWEDWTFCYIVWSSIIHMNMALSVLNTFSTSYTLNSIKFHSSTWNIFATTSSGKIAKVTSLSTVSYIDSPTTIINKLDLSSDETKFVVTESWWNTYISVDSMTTWQPSNEWASLLRSCACDNAFDHVFTNSANKVFVSP